uniref:Integrase core domain containing protein n=1 Tax=Solanum tuberosum TaxID=4113 RepID=M1DTP2_SOLTU
MAKMMTQLDILAKNVMGDGTRSVNVVGVCGVNPEEAKFKILYNEKVNFLANQGGGYCSNYPRASGNQGGIEMRVGDTVTESGVIVTPLGRKEKGRQIGSDKVLNEMKEDVSTLNQTVTSHSVSIKQL